MEKASGREPLDRYDDISKIFPLKSDFLQVYKIEQGKTIGSGGQANVFYAEMIVDGKIVPVALKRGTIRINDYVQTLDLHLYQREAELHKQL